MTETTMRPNLLQSLKIITKLRVDSVGENLAVLAINNVPLPVQEPRRDLELCRVLDDSDETLELIRVELTGTKVEKMCQRVVKYIVAVTYRLLRSTSAFLHTKLA